MSMINKDRTVSLLMGLMLPASIFQDTALQSLPLGSALASPAFLLLILIFFIRIFTTSSGKKFFKISNFYILYGLFFITINIFFLFHFGFVSHGESMILRAFKMIILFGCLFYTVYLFSFIKINSIDLWIRLAAFFTFGGILLNYIFSESWVSNWWIHYGVNDEKFLFEGFDNRPRGLSYESSTLGVTVITVGLLAAGTSRNSISYWLWLCVTAVGAGLTGSKAAIPLFIIVYFVSLFLVKGTRFLVYYFICLLLFIGFLYFTTDLWWPIFFEIIIEPFLLDIEKTSSISTRMTMGLVSILTAFYYPFGVGLTGYVPALVLNIQEASQLASELVGLPLNLNEVSRYLYQSDGFALGAKSFYFDAQIIFGIPFLFFWIGFHWQIYKRLRSKGDVIANWLLLMLFIPLTLYVPGVNLYILAIGYGWVINRSLTKST